LQVVVPMRRSSPKLGLAAVLMAVAASPSMADLVVFSGGHVLKVDGFEVAGTALRLRLPSGGGMRVPLDSVERIVGDELVPDTEVLDSAEVEEPLQLRFEDSHAIPETPFGEEIYEAARREGLNPALVAAMVRAESAFDPAAVSVKGARGLLQLMPATAQRFGVPASDLFDPERNLKAGTRYLSWLVEKFPGDLPRILAAYNAGEANVARYGGVPPFRETRGYIERIYGTLGLAAFR